MQIHFAGAQEVLQTTRSSNQNLEVTIFAHEPWTAPWDGSELASARCMNLFSASWVIDDQEYYYINVHVCIQKNM